VPIHPKKKRNLRLPSKPAALKPASVEELPRMLYVLKSLLSLTTKECQILFEIVIHMSSIFRKSGVKHTISYYSEVLRLIFEYISGRGLRQTKTWVKVYKSGLPKVIGPKMRDIIIKKKLKILNEDWMSDLRLDRDFHLLRAVISTVAFFRAMSPKHVIKFDSVTMAHTGTSKTLSKDIIKGALKSLGITKLKLSQPKFFWSNKAGVNAQFAFLSIGLDFLGILGHPSVWFGHIMYSIRMGYLLYLVIFLLMTIWCLPFFMMSYFVHGIFPLGRLSIVKELRGKARVVGITDYWTQILFKPLHDSIYSSLGKTPFDGTSNQLGPIYTLLYSQPKHVVSVDLTAATDRLPVLLQADILDALGLPGGWWMSILDRHYYYQDTPIKYAVGQPMGAYSSFAMLALTNHCIMHAAANSLDMSLEPGDYAILGDDVAIKGDILNIPYVQILTDLGVEVNPVKGFSGKLLEFAKRIYTVGMIDISPVGAKAVLRSSREPIYFITVLSDIAQKGYFRFLKPELTMFSNYLKNCHSKSNAIQQIKWLFFS